MTTRPGQARVPSTLQTVLTVANRGKNVNVPPPNRVASKTFKRDMIHKDQANSTQGGVFRRSRAQSGEKPPSEEKIKVSSMPSTKNHVSPQMYFNSVLKSRGYNFNTYKALASAYYNKPTELQKASYGPKLIESIRTNNIAALQDFMEAGLSPNACNNYGESIVHMVCRLGRVECLQVLLRYGCDLQVTDDYGRTPAHDACWAMEINFDLVDILLEKDRHLMSLEDARGALPLTYLKEEQWTDWTKYIMSRKDRFWPDRNVVNLGIESDPPLTLRQPNSRPVPNPKETITPELAKMVADGRMSAIEASLVKEEGDLTTEDSFSFDEEDDSDDDDDDSYSDYDSDSEAFDEQSELQAVLGSLCCFGKKKKAVAWSS